MTRYLRVHGVVYECMLVYAQSERLDPLAELVYEGLRHERDIERLSGAFGLPRNLVDNILIDLVRRGFAMLDIDRNQLLRVENPAAKPNYREHRTERIWFDVFTGGVIVERRVRPRFRRPDDPSAEVVLQTLSADVHDFLALPNAEIISQLVRHEPALEWEDGRAWRLDKITARRRTGEAPLWLEIDEIKLFNETVELVHDEDLPLWMTRSWTNAHARQSGRALVSTLPLDPTPALRDDGELDLLAATSLPATLAKWSAAMNETLDRAPRPTSMSELSELRDAEAVLTKVIESRATVELGEGSAFKNLDDVTRSALVVLDEWRDEAAAGIAAALSKMKSMGAFVDLGVLVPGGRERLVPALLRRGVDEPLIASRLIVGELRRGVRASCVLLDDREVRFAAAENLAVGGWLRFAPHAGDDLTLARSLRAAIETLCNSDEFAAWVRQRSTERARRRAAEEDALDRPFVLTAKVCDLVRRPPAPGAHDDETTTLRSLAADDEAKMDDLIADARVTIEQRIADRGAVCRSLDCSERLELLTHVLERAQAGGAPGTIRIATRIAGGLALDPGFADAIGRALTNGWRVEFAAAPEVAGKLVAMLGAGKPPDVAARLAADSPLPFDCSIIGIRDWYCISTRDWLDADVDAPCLTVLIERPGLADAWR